MPCSPANLSPQLNVLTDENLEKNELLAMLSHNLREQQLVAIMHLYCSHIRHGSFTVLSLFFLTQVWSHVRQLILFVRKFPIKEIK